jgi:serine/threonine protein kinase
MNSAFPISNQTPVVELPSDGAVLPANELHPHQDVTSEDVTSEDVTSFQNAVGQVQPSPTHLFKNRFEIIRRLGKGGFGTTYLAQDVSTPQPLPCVIKQLQYKIQPETNPPEQSLYNRAKSAIDQERSKRRFQRETRMMARLGRHNQLPCLLDHFTDGNQFYLVQEHVPGDTLSREIGRSGPQSEQQAKQFLREMIPIIRYIHRQNLLHLDIKPSNIMRRSSDQKLVLIDFGAVRRYPRVEALDSSDSLGRLRHRTTGTLGFSPSEQLTGQPTTASDIYALGVTCLYLLTKISPIDLATSAKGQNLRWQESVKLSDHFTHILGKMLHPEASRRYQDTNELERALNLENHYPDLKTCLTTEPMTDKTFAPPAACPIVKTGNPENQSLAQRQAESIRHWQQRRRQFKSFTPR